MSRPNILVVFVDQMRGDCLGSLPGSQVITPYLDRLSAEGVTYTGCQTNSPLCVPARSVFHTGQLVRENGCWSNRLGPDELGPSHVRNIRNAGYHTAVIGKTHLWRDGPGGKRGRHVRECAHLLEAMGFDFCHEVNDPIETRYMGCYYTDYLASKGWLEAHQRYMQAWVDEMYSGNVTPWAQEPAPVPDGEDIDSYIGRTAETWLRDYDQAAPFYLQVQFTGPHDPFDAPQKYRDLYDASSLDPGQTERHASPLPSIGARRRRSQAVAHATTYQRQRWRVNYYGNITLLDDLVGDLLNVLAATGRLENTWVVFASDHGEMLGDHGLSSKAVFYREAMHVPCIVRPPVVDQTDSGRRSDALTDHTDLTATLIDIADAEPLDSIGRSLKRHVLSSSEPVGKTGVVSELFGETTIVTSASKLTVRAEDNEPVLLYDLESDPEELENVVEHPDYVERVREITEEHLLPLASRTQHDKLDDYRAYVKRTGSVN
jgi:choline-sulfatase